MPRREPTPAERRIQVRQVTHVQASWAELERGAPGAFTLQLILDHGADEYVLRPTATDADVLVMTLFAEQRKVLDSIRAGAHGYLLIDQPLEECAYAIREIRRGGSPISPMIARQLLDRMHPNAK